MSKYIIKCDEGISIPIDSRSKYAFELIKHETSVFYADATPSIRAAASAFSKKHKIRLAVREWHEGGKAGFRVWNLGEAQKKEVQQGGWMPNSL